MPTVTASLLVDLDDTGNFSTDITEFWERDNGFDFPAQGRNEDLGLAEMGRATFVLDNTTGVFSPGASAFTSSSFAEGTYTGNSANGRQITGLGFQPKVVIIKGALAGEAHACIRTDTMSGGRQVTTSSGTVRIDSLDADGFTVSYNLADASNVNESGTTYYWVAWGGASVVTTTYVGSNPSFSKTGIGGPPVMVWIVPSDGTGLRIRTSTMSESYDFNVSAGSATEITALGADGFTVGSSLAVNTTAVTYHAVCFLASPGLQIGTYTGTGSAQPISLGLTPAMVHVKGDIGQEPIFKTSSMPTGDSSNFYGTGVQLTNQITSLTASGFTVGTHARVNNNLTAYHYFAMTSGALGRFEPYHLIKATITYDGTDYEAFYGMITKVQTDPGNRIKRTTVQASDLMYVLQRTDIKCPLMQQNTGVIIQRLLDYAEVGEVVTNPRFDALQLLQNYSAIATATLTRWTDVTSGGAGALLEATASCKVNANANHDGIRYTIPTSVAGQKFKVVAYVLSDPNNPGGNVYIQMADSVGTVATGSDTAVRTLWTRLEVSGTYNGGSSSQYIQVRRSVGGAFSWFVGAVHATPAVSAITRAVDDGVSVLDAFTYHRGNALRAIQEVTENELGGLFYFDGSTAKFEDKQHRWISDHQTSQITFDERGIPLYEETAEDRIKEVALDFPRWIEGEESQIFKLDRVPIAIPDDGSVTIEGDYGGGVARLVSLPTPTTDYTADNGSTDESANVLVTEWEDLGGGFRVTLENQQPYTVFLTSFRVTGVPIRRASDMTPARAEGADGPALSAVLSHNFTQNGRETALQSWAQFLADRYDEQVGRLRLTITAPFPTATGANDTDMTAILERKVSDRITFTNNNLDFSLGISQDFFIDRISRQIDGRQVTCDWDLTRTDPLTGNYFIIGTSTIGGADVIGP